MKKNKKFSIAIVLISFAGAIFAQPLAFYKGCLVTSLTRGPSRAIYSTISDDKRNRHSESVPGKIDPLIMEYGISDKVGVGFTYGGDNYDVNANTFYGAKLPDGSNTMSASSKYFTFDGSYHALVTKRIDVAAFGALGFYSLWGGVWQYDNAGKFTGKDMFSYYGCGAVARGGIRARVYLTKRFGVMGMVYAFKGMVRGETDTKTEAISDGMKPTKYTTNIMGAGMELGICCRLFKQKGLKKETPKSADIASDGGDEKERLITFSWD